MAIAALPIHERQLKERERIVESKLGKYLKDGEIREQFQELERYPIKKVREAQNSSINQYDYAALGKMLEQQRDYIQFAEDTGSLSQLGQMPTVALGTTTAVYGASPLMAFCSVQPMDEEVGLVYYQSTVAQNTRGNVTKNDKLLDSLALPDSFPNGFASNRVIGEQLVNTTNPGQTLSNLQLGNGKEYMGPIRLQTMDVYGSALFGSDQVVFPTMKVDQDSFTFSGGQVVNDTLYSVAGAVDFETGRVTSLKFGPTAPSLVTLFTDYEVLAEAGQDLPSVQTILTTKSIRARLFALKSTMGVPQAFQLEKRLGISGSDLLAKNLTMCVINEQVNIALALLNANIPTISTTNPITWERKPPSSNTSTFEHQMTLEYAMSDASERLLQQAGRGAVNVWICGRRASTILSNTPGFVKLYNENTQGPHIFGTFKGAVVVRVPYDALLDPLKMIGICKGDNPFDSALVYSPYMPMVMTGLLPNGLNPLLNQRGVAVWAGLDTLVENLITCMFITQASDFAY